MKDSIINDKSKEFALRIIKLYKYLTLKAEASETEYWLELLYESEYIDEKSYSSIINDNIEIIRILTRIVKNTE